MVRRVELVDDGVEKAEINIFESLGEDRLEEGMGIGIVRQDRCQGVWVSKRVVEDFSALAQEPVAEGP